MPKPKPVSYKDSGVNIGEADKLVDYLKTINPAIGGFSGLVPLPGKGMKKPMLVASTDGVGTKLLIAREMGDYSTIGIDLVAMVVNDMAVCGARPMFFLDYYATGKLKLAEARQVIKGIVEGCRQAQCALIGGETAELPGLYNPGDFDLAGFGVGVVDAAKALPRKTIRPGDLVFGIASSGLHSNGFSLVRRALLEKTSLSLKKKAPGLGNAALGKVLLVPTRIYTELVNRLLAKNVPLKALAHITGGGIPGNLNRVLPTTLNAVIQEGSWPVPPFFLLIEKQGPVAREEMYRAFNMGLGMMGIIGKNDLPKLEAEMKRLGEPLYVVGTIVKGGGAVEIR